MEPLRRRRAPVGRLLGAVALAIAGLGPAPAHGQPANGTASTCAAPGTGGCTACAACCVDMSPAACGMCVAAQCASRCTGECNVCDACCQPWFALAADCDACVSATCSVHEAPPLCTSCTTRSRSTCQTCSLSSTCGERLAEM